MPAIQKNDFIEIEFTGKANGEIFDTTSKNEAKQIGLDADVKPIIISVGNGMLLKGFDELIEGKEVEKKYSVSLDPEKAFGTRNPKLIKIVPMKSFKEQNMNPVKGMTLQLDNHIAKVLSVSGGRVIVDFNNPLAGKEVSYDFKILRKVTDNKEKINSIQDFFFKQRFEFKIDEKNKKVIFKDEKLSNLFRIMGSKFNDITGFDFIVEKKVKKDENREKPKEDLKKVENKKIQNI